MAQSQVPTIEHVSVSGNDTSITVAIAASQPVTPQAQLLSEPDRIVVDLPGAVPSRQLRDIPVGGAVRSVRVALFSSKPPVTRIVLDLKIAQKYEVSAVGNTVLVKVTLAQQLPTQSNKTEPN
ncbi:MAG: AMIN domain-containing protein [Acidobacteriaceae bacterium]|nr:AMIN domain-containing protein [Acidobacteriaceae bacterium]